MNDKGGSSGQSLLTGCMRVEIGRILRVACMSASMHTYPLLFLQVISGCQVRTGQAKWRNVSQMSSELEKRKL